MFVSIEEVRKKFRKEGAQFQKGYFEGFNNPLRVCRELPAATERINTLLISGKMDKKISDFYDGLKRGLKDKGYGQANLMAEKEKLKKVI